MALKAKTIRLPLFLKNFRQRSSHPEDSWTLLHFLFRCVNIHERVQAARTRLQKIYEELMDCHDLNYFHSVSDKDFHRFGHIVFKEHYDRMEYSKIFFDCLYQDSLFRNLNYFFQNLSDFSPADANYVTSIYKTNEWHMISQHDYQMAAVEVAALYCLVKKIQKPQEIDPDEWASHCGDSNDEFNGQLFIFAINQAKSFLIKTIGRDLCQDLLKFPNLTYAPGLMKGARVFQDDWRDRRYFGAHSGR